MVMLVAACTWIDDSDWEDRVADLDRDEYDDDDCDDDDEDVNPGEDEIEANGVDEDCDGWDYVGVLSPGSESCAARVREGGRLEARWKLHYDGEGLEETTLLQFLAHDGASSLLAQAEFGAQGDFHLRVTEETADGAGESGRLAKVEGGDTVSFRMTVDARAGQVYVSADGVEEGLDITVDDPVAEVCAPNSWPSALELTEQITVYAGD